MQLYNIQNNSQVVYEGFQRDPQNSTINDLALGTAFLLKENETDQDLKKQVAAVDLSFLSRDSLDPENGTPCSLHVRYRKDDPNKWMMIFIKDTNLDSTKQRMCLLSGINPFEFFPPKQLSTLNISTASTAYFIQQSCFTEPSIENYILQLVSEEGLVASGKEDLIASFKSQLLPHNRALEILQKLNLAPSSDQIKGCMDTKSYLYKAICFFGDKKSLNDATKKELCSNVLNTYWHYTERLATDNHIKNDINKVLEKILLDKKDYNQDVNILALIGIATRHIGSISSFERINYSRETYLLLKVSLINRIRDLGLTNSNEMIDALWSIEHPPEQNKYFPLLLSMQKIESTCDAIRDRLSQENPQKHQDSQTAERDYRRAMHALVYEQVLRPKDSADFLEKMKKIEEPLLQVLNVDKNPWLRKALQVLVNALSLLFTLGYANVKHQEKTGDFFFFSRPKSAEALKTLDKDLAEDYIMPPKGKG